MSKYFGVIGNRDYIKIKGEKRPFWEFLNVQPDGWLTSLAYTRKDYPSDRGPMIWDCGAWSYKDKDHPSLGKTLLTPAVAVGKYIEHAIPEDFLVCPDHMLINHETATHRRRINEANAVEFLKTCPVGYKPLAVIHGMDDGERLLNAKFLVDIGYNYLSVGGVAARAAQKPRVVETVSRLRDIVPGYLHVLGLSSPPYARMWRELGVDSFDGSSHFKQAFTGGAFFTVGDDGRLIKHQAARTCRETGKVIGEIVAPECGCDACQALRDEGIDTRTYGSNENNMGRAAHNMNMLMEAQKWEIFV